jgi:hypothetical protein
VNKRTLSFDLNKQIAPVAGMASGPSVMVVNPALPVTTVAEFIAYAKANPGKVNMGSAGVATTSHMAGELFKAMAGIDLVHVPYRGAAPALTDLIGGQVQLVIDAMISTLPHIRSGKLRALGVTTATRSDVLPDLPSIAETVPAMRPSSGTASACRRARPRMSCAGSIARSMPASRHRRSNRSCASSRADDHGPVPTRRLRALRDRGVGEGDQAVRHQGGLRRRHAVNSRIAISTSR